jgi:hypothetical protein
VPVNHLFASSSGLDPSDSKSAGRKAKRVQFPPPAACCVRIFPIEKPLWDEEWTNLASTPNAVHRFVFLPRERDLSFYVTFVLDESGERAYAMWEQSVFSVQMAGKRSKEFGADELEAWPSQFLVPKGFVAAKLAEIYTVWLHSSYTATNCHIIGN